MHEHVTIDLSGVKKDDDCHLDCFEETVREFRQLYEYGVRNILDVTNRGMGRNPEYVARVEAATGIRILLSTGFYKEPFLPQEVYDNTVEELAGLISRELTEGIGSSGPHASVIGEFGTSKDRMMPMEEKVFEAMALAAVRTGAPVSTHTTLGTCGREQLDYLTARGVKPEKIIIGHMDLSQDLEKILDLLSRGANVGFDTIGKLNYSPDTFRVAALKEIHRQGMLSQVVLSMDITRKTHLRYKGGIGYSYLFEAFLPLLEEHGFTQEQIDLLLIDNPRRILG